MQYLTTALVQIILLLEDKDKIAERQTEVSELLQLFSFIDGIFLYRPGLS